MVKTFDVVLVSATRKRTKMCTTGTLRQHDFLAFQSYDGYCFVALPCHRRTVRQQQSHCSYEVFQKEPPLGINTDDLEKLLLYFVLSKGSQRTINFNLSWRSISVFHLLVVNVVDNRQDRPIFMYALIGRTFVRYACAPPEFKVQSHFEVISSSIVERSDNYWCEIYDSCTRAFAELKQSQIFFH